MSIILNVFLWNTFLTGSRHPECGCKSIHRGVSVSRGRSCFYKARAVHKLINFVALHFRLADFEYSATEKNCAYCNHRASESAVRICAPHRVTRPLRPASVQTSPAWGDEIIAQMMTRLKIALIWLASIVGCRLYATPQRTGQAAMPPTNIRYCLDRSWEWTGNVYLG